MGLNGIKWGRNGGKFEPKCDKNRAKMGKIRGKNREKWGKK